MTASFKIAVIPGDGIGREVMPEGLRALDAAAGRFGVRLEYINLRPAKTFAGVPCPLAGRGPGDIDFMIVRENTEGEYSSVGGTMFEGTEREFVTQQAIFTRHGTERVMKFAFELAQRRPRKLVTVATKSNGIAISMPWWDARAAEVARLYPDITWDKQHIDILCARFVLQPQRFDVVVASNLFGDILSDLGGSASTTAMGTAIAERIAHGR